MNVSVKLCAAALPGIMMHLSVGCASVPGRLVNSLSVVQIGGIEQAVLARGADESLPVLLWLHGGPGAAHMPLAHKYNTDLEEFFEVPVFFISGSRDMNTPVPQLDGIER